MPKRRLLDLFCKAGGATRGYQLSGFHVTGVDIEFQPNYIGDDFIVGDALEFVQNHGHKFDVIHASPPCQRYSSITKTAGTHLLHPDLIPPVRELLKASGKPYIIENVRNAPLINPLMLCGTMFSLDVIRHRLFETRPVIWFPPASCNHYKPVVKHGRPVDLETQFHGVTGHFSGVKEAQLAMGIDWMNQDELREAIPPVYTEWLGKKMMSDN